MSLRTRLALALAVIAGVSVVAVGAIGYFGTAHELHSELDASLVSYANGLADPDGRAISSLCSNRSPLSSDEADAGRLVAGLPGASIECITAGGAIGNWISEGTTPPPVPDALARRRTPGVSRAETVVDGRRVYRFVTVTSQDGSKVRVGRSLAEIDRALDSIRARAFGVGALVIAVAGLAGLLIARRVTKPVEALTTTAEQIARTGRIDLPVPVGRSDEIGRLATSFETMLGALSESRDQQQQLAQDAGHELRTPLTSMRTNIGTLRRHPDLPANTRDETLASVASELTELTALVDELVELAIEEPGQEETAEVRLDQAVAHAVQRASRRSGREVLLEAEPVTVRARPRLLARAVNNLLDNALKFSPAASVVEVQVRPRELVVRDHGGGIAPADLPHVFDRFYRALEARSRPGSGLGLAIVRRAADDSGAMVSAGNHPNGGAVLTMRWPDEPPEDAPRMEGPG